MADELLRDILLHLHEIQRSYRDSMGGDGTKDTYVPQLSAKKVDKLAARVKKEVARREDPDVS